MVPLQYVGRGDRLQLGRAAETVGNLSIEASHHIFWLSPTVSQKRSISDLLYFNVC
jgi:hypothetical protein